jgi:hypothetical protein
MLSPCHNTTKLPGSHQPFVQYLPCTNVQYQACTFVQVFIMSFRTCARAGVFTVGWVASADVDGQGPTALHRRPEESVLCPRGAQDCLFVWARSRRKGTSLGSMGSAGYVPGLAKTGKHPISPGTSPCSHTYRRTRISKGSSHPLLPDIRCVPGRLDRNSAGQ